MSGEEDPAFNGQPQNHMYFNMELNLKSADAASRSSQLKCVQITGYSLLFILALAQKFRVWFCKDMGGTETTAHTGGVGD